MVDIVSPETRRRMMAGIKGKNTKPELIIRQGLHRVGFRFRLHRADLPGKPDLVLPRYKAAVFVNGCFWHGHGCSLFKWPQSRPDFWRRKIDDTKARDLRNSSELQALGWRELRVWECALKGRNRLPLEQVISACAKWLAGTSRSGDITEL